MLKWEKLICTGQKAGTFFLKVREELFDFRGHPGRITFSVVEYIPLIGGGPQWGKFRGDRDKVNLYLISNFRTPRFLDARKFGKNL